MYCVTFAIQPYYSILGVNFGFYVQLNPDLVLRSLRRYIEVLYSSEYLFTDLPWVLSGGGDMSCYIMYVCMYVCAHTYTTKKLKHYESKVCCKLYNACMVPNGCQHNHGSFFLHTKMCISLCALSRKRYIVIEVYICVQSYESLVWN